MIPYIGDTKAGTLMLGIDIEIIGVGLNITYLGFYILL